MARADRFHSETKASDQRGEFQRDRDRILYCSAYRRLAGVTQVAGAAEGHPFHNRLTHSMKVSQVARRLAEHLLQHPHADQRELARRYEVQPEVAEAAGQAHDIGHPPFGHVGEEVLDARVCEVLESEQLDGFEGNAQTFRILTRLAVHREGKDGLNLTRATLCAVLKYPWHRDPDHPKRSKKWGVYQAEREYLGFAKSELGTSRSAEAEIMDWADDIAYAVHDLEDFYRAGLLPLGELANMREETSELCRVLEGRFSARNGTTPYEAAWKACSGVFSHLSEALHVPYCGSREQRGALRYFTSLLVGRLLRAFRLREPTDDNRDCAEVAPNDRDAAEFLKGLMAHYIFKHPSLAAQQEGQRRILGDLFDVMLAAADGEKDFNLLPRTTRDLLAAQLGQPKNQRTLRVRAVVDSIAGMSEEEVYRIHRRLTGADVGRLTDRILY